MPFTIHVKKRPGVEFFLKRASEFFELVIYTASLSEVLFISLCNYFHCNTLILF